jgi:hypothetical protein
MGVEVGRRPGMGRSGGVRGHEQEIEFHRCRGSLDKTNGEAKK